MSTIRGNTSGFERAERIKQRDSMGDPEEVAMISGLPIDVINSLDSNKVGEQRTTELTRHVGKALAQHVIRQAEVPTINPFVLYSVDELRKAPTPDMHIEGVLPVGSDAMLFGQAYSGKSLVVVDQLLSMANGIPWMGHETRCQNVVYIVGEGQRGVSKRIDAWLLAHPGCTDDRLQVVTRMPDIRNHTEVVYLLESLANTDFLLPGPIGVLAWDTWSRLTVGANEQDNTAMTECVTTLSHIRQAFGGTIVSEASNLVVHHTGHQEIERPRGASAFLGAFDTMLRVERGLIVNTKQKDNDEFEDIDFEIVKYGDSVTIHKMGFIDAAAKRIEQGRSEIRRKFRELLSEENDRNITALRRAVKGHKNTEKNAVLDEMLADEEITKHPGSKAREVIVHLV